MKSQRIVIANWKMNPATEREAISLAKASDKEGAVLCPPFVYLSAVKKTIKKAKLGAQDSFYEERGAYTGEVSAEMLQNLGVKYAILGHSERRAQGESNEIVGLKIKAAVSAGLIPILCVGEKERDESHEYLKIIRSQLDSLSKAAFGKILIAYEPIWAIGKNATREATPEEFREMSVFIKKILFDKFSAQAIEKTRIIYGGSVHPENCAAFLAEGAADGFLVGRDSLDPKKFGEIIKICEASGK